MSRDKLKSRRSNFKSRMKRFRRLRKVAGKKAVRILNTGLQPGFSYRASIYGLSSMDLRNMRRSSSVANNTNKAGKLLFSIAGTFVVSCGSLVGRPMPVSGSTGEPCARSTRDAAQAGPERQAVRVCQCGGVTGV